MEIPLYVISILAFLHGLEYFIRFAILRPITYFWLGKAIVRFYIAILYLMFYYGTIPGELGHFLGRAGIVVLFCVDLMYIFIEHVGHLKGYEHRNNWPKIFMPKVKKV